MVEVTAITFEAPKKSLFNLKQAVVAVLANQRQANAQVKNRGDVRGGGKKPWRQKGTGRARVGSSRTPVWRGGGVVFGPTTMRNYTQKVNTKEARLALSQAIAVLAADNKLFTATTDLAATKTKEVMAYVASLPNITGTPTLVLKESNRELSRVAANSKAVQLKNAANLNLQDLTTAQAVVFMPGAWEIFEARLVKETK